MSKPEDIPQDVWTAATAEAVLFADWLSAGNSTGSLSDHATSALADSFARAILAERERILAMLAAGAPHSPRRYIYDTSPDRRVIACDRLEAAIRKGGAE